MQFAHERLHVYQKGLDWFGGIQQFLSSWSNEWEIEDSKQLLVRVGQMTARKGYAD